MYDFQGMNSRLQSFRQLEPSEGHQVRNLSWSPSADRFLCVTGSAQAKVWFIYFFMWVSLVITIWSEPRQGLWNSRLFLFVSQIFDRDGLTLGEFVKGDMYIRDLKNTKGHISGLTCGEWHPQAKETILTSSEDGSLRIWDVNDFKSQKQVCCFFKLLNSATWNYDEFHTTILFWGTWFHFIWQSTKLF
jgi:WD40 repeat protein